MQSANITICYSSCWSRLFDVAVYSSVYGCVSHSAGKAPPCNPPLYFTKPHDLVRSAGFRICGHSNAIGDVGADVHNKPGEVNIFLWMCRSLNPSDRAQMKKSAVLYAIRKIKRRTIKRRKCCANSTTNIINCSVVIGVSRPEGNKEHTHSPN